MQIAVYTNDVESADYVQKSLKNVEKIEWIDDIVELAGLYNHLVIMVLENDVRSNELLLREIAKRDNKILLLQRVPTLEAAKFYLSAGIRGYGNVMMHPIYFDAALETISSAMIWLHPEITARLIHEVTPTNDRHFLSQLSQREQEIALLLLEGKTNHEIAVILEITPRTVKAHASNLYHKLQAKDRLDFALRYK